MHELGWRKVDLLSEDWPLVVVEVEHRHDRNEVHVGVEVGVDGSNIAPVAVVALGGARDLVEGEVVDSGVVAAHHVGNDVATHVVARVFEGAVMFNGIDQSLRGEYVVAHRGKNLVGGVGKGLRIRWLLEEGCDLGRVGRVHFDYTELVSQRHRLANGSNGNATTGSDVVLNHLVEVHAVDVVRTNNNYIVWAFIAQ